MKFRKYLWLFGILLLNYHICQSRNILTPKAAQDYSQRKIQQPEIASRIEIPVDLDPMEKEALEFLYAYISTPDALDYDRDFFLENVRLALKASEEMPWGNSVPDREWRHFVLPIRVNNENLDLSRKVFYDELKERVKGLSMTDALLEVNHWCHEKVSYQPSDARTSSPLATVCNALGRCGEESTFTVAALRSVGIPARQVYTPRWAHTDDNHAWVEAWADGKWHFIGACEPEAVPDLAWFNAPASRGMLITTNVTGFYDGPEEQIAQTPISTVINVTENYAPVILSKVFVTDTQGNPLENVDVTFSLYNYAEFYPLAIKKTDKTGMAQFKSGCGDMIVWATDGNNFNFSKLTAGDTLHLSIDKYLNPTGSYDFDLIPPPSGGNLPEVSEESARLNELRKAYEDSIRLSYVNTFLSSDKALQICQQIGINPVAADYLVKARGNHRLIESFLKQTPEQLRERAVALLGVISEKDLHDVSPDVLEDHLIHTIGDESSPLFIPYVLNPRIEYEMLHPFKKNIHDLLSEEEINAFTSDPLLIAEYLKENIIKDSYNPGNYRQSSTSTLTAKTADELNRSITFVAICRSLGVPARIDPVSHLTQYADHSGNWQDVSFNKDPAIGPDDTLKSELSLILPDDSAGKQPKYYSQFSISKIIDGKPVLLEFDDFATAESINLLKQPISPGRYLLVTGQRLADGSVLAKADIFEANQGEKATPALIVRQDSTALQVIGTLDAELTYQPYITSAVNDKISKELSKLSILSTTGRGYYVLGIIAPGHEPSSHALNDIALAAEELLATGRTILLLFTDDDSAARFRLSDFGQLPSNVVFGVDDGSIYESLCEGLDLPLINSTDLPVFVMADTFNRIVYFHKGYTINLGEKLANLLNSVE